VFEHQIGSTLHTMSLTRLALVVTLLVGAAGCGGHGVEPKTWAGSVCAALTPWRAKINTLTLQAQQQLSTAKTAAQTKTNVVDLLSGAESASETARKGVAAAGTPDVADGERIATHFTGSLQKARDAYGHARTSVAGLSTGDAKKFYTGVKAVFDTLGTEYAASALDTSNVGSADLQKAFNEVPECR
jgi:hypothetical protein